MPHSLNPMLVTVSAALEGVNLGRVLLDLTIILLVAKLAAEASDRIRIPAVIGEIAAGIVIGPSVLGLVSASDMLFVLAEFGVIFLLILPASDLFSPCRETSLLFSVHSAVTNAT